MAEGPSVFTRSLPYSEIETLNILLPYIKSSMKFQEISVIAVDDALAALDKGDPELTPTEKGWDRQKIEIAEPGSPETVFWNV